MSAKHLNTNAKTAVITGMSYLDLDRVFASFVLARVIANKTNQPVDISLGFALPHSIYDRLAVDNINVVNDISLAQRSLELTNLMDEVRDVKWKKTAAGIELEIINLNGEKIDPTGTELKFKSGKYENAYLIGVRSAKYLLKLLSNTKEADLAEVKLTSINIVNKREVGFAANQYINDKVQSFSAATYAFAKKQNLNLTKQDLNDLLSGIYWKTNAFRNYYTTSETFGIAKQLVDEGADPKVSNKEIYSTLGGSSLKNWESILNNVQKHDDILVCEMQSPLDYDDFANLQISPIISPLVFADAKATLLLAEQKSGGSMAIITSNQGEINLSKEFGEFQPKGDDQQIKISSELPLAELRQKLFGILDISKPNDKQEDSKPPVPEPTENSDPLSPAQFNMADFIDESEDDNNSGNQFGFGAGSDPLPQAKK